MEFDLISRQQAIDHFERTIEASSSEDNCSDYNDGFIDGLGFCIGFLKYLPSPTEEEFEWCRDCKEYDQEACCCHRWTKFIKQTIDEIKAHEKTTEVERIDMKNERNIVYKCKNCGQYMHKTNWSTTVKYCSLCGKKINWSSNEKS